MLGFPMSSRRKSKRRRRLCRARSPVISSHGDVFSAEIVESLFSRPAHTPTVYGGSESEIAVSRQRRGGVSPTGRVAKQKTTRFEAIDDDDVYRRGSGEFQADGAAGDRCEVRRLG
ncbi:hypothetical protein PHJA_002781400 [Phtheirospermum japonicum]|uniref:Uncharacterized protein n=1 Tax=Phtheirospermum japonicum TaxID=374723 RepID=A0A830DEH6_9LAMI|nr:hypothetical protein PHJA_002781400 [Phtheirospermum japonicum]